MIDDLAKQILTDFKNVREQFASEFGFSNARSDPGKEGSGNKEKSESLLKAVIEANLAKLNLVTKEQFDGQVALLQRTEARVTALEEQLSLLEQQLNSPVDSAALDTQQDSSANKE